MVKEIQPRTLAPGEKLDAVTPPLGTPIVSVAPIDEPSKIVDVPLTAEQKATVAKAADAADNARVAAIRAAAKPHGKKLPDELVRACIFRNIKPDDAAAKCKDFVETGYTWVDRAMSWGTPKKETK